MVFVPVAALIALSLVAPGTRPSVAKAFAVLAANFAILLAVRFLVPDYLLWPDSEVARRARWAVRHLDGNPGWEGKPVVILAGSSATLFGLDPVSVERHLAILGTPVSVLSFSMAGATHYERRYAIESFLQQLGAEGRAKLARARVIFLTEVFDDYDKQPLFRLDKEAFTERAIQYLSPANAWRAWKAYGSQQKPKPALSRWSVASLLSQHALLNRFAAGAFSQMRWPLTQKKTTKPFFALDKREEGFDFERTLEAWRTYTAGCGADSATHPSLQWELSRVHLDEPLAPFLKDRGYYCLPTIEPHRARYARAFATWARAESYEVIGPPTRNELQALLHREMWYDGVHPLGGAVPHVSKWFAQRLKEQFFAGAG